MKTKIRILSLLLIAFMMLSLVSCNKEQEPKAEPKAQVGVLKGPTGVGAVKLYEKNSLVDSIGKYDIFMYETANANALVTNVLNGSVDIAAVPINTAGILYNKTNGGVSIIAANALGVLSMVGYDEMTDIKQLKGVTIHTVNKGATPEYILRYVLEKNGLDPQKDVEILFYSTPADAVAAATAYHNQGKVSVAMIPEPALTVNLTKSPELKLIFDMTDEWDKVSTTKLIQGVVVVRNEFLRDHPDVVATFLDDYSESVGFVNGNHSEAAKLMVEYGIVNNEAVAEKSIPNCNVVCITGTRMKESVFSMLEVLYGSNPASIGGALPSSNICYVASNEAK
ncbi:MAG: ABC transporter substrate-binding protein [Clostridia bacterium]|nr:ABC transporter substrate-binding protein [Clostridia bacterium]